MAKVRHSHSFYVRLVGSRANATRELDRRHTFSHLHEAVPGQYHQHLTSAHTFTVAFQNFGPVVQTHTVRG